MFSMVLLKIGCLIAEKIMGVFISNLTTLRFTPLGENISTNKNSPNTPQYTETVYHTLYGLNEDAMIQ